MTIFREALVPQRSVRGWASTALVVASLSGARSSSADEGFAVGTYEPSERGSDWFANESLDLRGHLRWATGAIGDYSYRSLVVRNPSGDIVASPVRNDVKAHIGGAVTLFDRIRLAANLPIVAFVDGREPSSVRTPFRAPDGTTGLGDLRLAVDARLDGSYGAPSTLAFGVQAWVPTGQQSLYAGNGTLRIGPRLGFAGDVQSFTYALRFGLVFREPNAPDAIADDLGSALPFGGAFGVRALGKRLVVGPEINGSTTLANALGKGATPIEVLFGAHYGFGDLRLGAGAGTRLTAGYGAPVARMLFSIEYVPGPAPKTEDRDHDRILDEEDACPDVPGVPTGDPRSNGCPPPPPLDRDGDGIPDSEDACLDAKGQRSTDPSANGCPARGPLPTQVPPPSPLPAEAPGEAAPSQAPFPPP